MAGVMDLESLRAELVEKEKNLVLAALAGKDLLEENKKLRQELNALKEDEAALEEALRTKYLGEVKLAQLHICELELELESYRCRLKEDKAATSSAENDFRIACKQFAEENSRLEQHLEQVTEKYNTEVKQLRLRLQESENIKGIISQDYNQTERSLLELQSENETIGRSLSSMHESNEQLSLELEGTKEEVGLWEYKYHSQEEELHYRSKELDNSKDLLMQLQQELHQKVKDTHKTAVSQGSSRTSLYDEMFQVEEMASEITYEEVMVGQDQTTCEEEVDEGITPVAREEKQKDQTTLASDAEQYTLEDDRFQTLRPKQKQETGTAGGGEAKTKLPCQRCQELEMSEKEKEEELKNITKLLLRTVHRKFELQQEINAWEADMTQVLASTMEQKLRKDKKKWSNPKLKTSKDKAHRTFSFQLIKNSWSFFD